MQAYQGLAITLVCRRMLALIKNVQPQRWLITNPAAVGSFRCVYMGQSQKLNIQPRSRSPLVQLAGIRKSFDGKTVIDNLNLTINNGEFLTLLGPSGCGKTTVLRLIAGLENVDSGRIHLEDHDITHVPAENRHVNTVFQSYALFPHMTVFENVAFGLRMQKTPAAEITPRVLDALKMVQLEDFAQRKPHQLSGGQQQRVSIARALVRNPAIILADEPTGALDSHTGREVIGMLQQLHREGHTVVLITHDNSIAVQAERIIRLEDGQVVYDGDAHAPEAVVQPTLSGEAAQEEAK